MQSKSTIVDPIKKRGDNSPVIHNITPEPNFNLNFGKITDRDRNSSPFGAKQRSVSNNSFYKSNQDKGLDLSDPIAATDF
jgi:hypothetical protein